MDIVSMYTIPVWRAPEAPTPGYLVWRIATRLRAAVDRGLAPLGLTHAQYTLLASLYGLSRSGAHPSQRELADWTGLEPIFVSKLARALERAGLIARDEHPQDPRAIQLRLTEHGVDVAQRAIAIVKALQEEFTAPIGGTQSQQTRAFVRTLQTLLANNDTGDTPMAPPATLTGQDVGEAEGALTGLLNQVLASTNTGITRAEYIALRVVASRGATESAAALQTFLASQPQLGLEDSAQASQLLQRLAARGLISGGASGGAAPVRLTAEGAALNARLNEAVATVTRRLYADLPPEDLATAHRVLADVTERAQRLRDEL
jgi:DNA-binding MarR family transcriptional regulator